MRLLQFICICILILNGCSSGSTTNGMKELEQKTAVQSKEQDAEKETTNELNPENSTIESHLEADYVFLDNEWGEFYIGEMKNGLPNGKGTRYRNYENVPLDFPGNILYEGEFLDGEFHGMGTAYYGSGSVEYSGKWEHGQPVEGQGEKSYAPTDGFESAYEEEIYNALMDLSESVDFKVELFAEHARNFDYHSTSSLMEGLKGDFGIFSGIFGELKSRDVNNENYYVFELIDLGLNELYAASEEMSKAYEENDLDQIFHAYISVATAKARIDYSIGVLTMPDELY